MRIRRREKTTTNTGGALSGSAGQGKILLACLLAAAIIAPVPAQAKTIEINSGKVNINAYGNSGNSDGSDHTLTPNGHILSIGAHVRQTGAVIYTLAGGFTAAPATEVFGNTVTIQSGGKIDPGIVIYGGRSDHSGDVNNNRATVAGGQVDCKIYGGYAKSGEAAWNTVTIHTGSTVTGDVTGGFAGGGSDAYSNTVNIENGAVVSGKLTGGASESGRSFSNVLNLKNSNLTIRGLADFQVINFYVPEDLAANGKMIIMGPGCEADITRAAINVGIEGSSSPLAHGDTIVLIDAEQGSLTGADSITKGEGIRGISSLLDFDVTASGNSLLATVAGVEGPGDGGQIGTQLKSLAESRVSGIGMLTQGADMLAMQGIPQLRASAMQNSGPAMFGVMGGQSLRYNSGSHVDVEGFNLATGLGWNFALDEGRRGNLLVGAFFEAGWGSYDSHNSFGNAASVKGDGDTEYYGGGILGRYDTAPIGPGNLYLEASFRAGKVETDYSSSDFLNSSFTGKVDFDSSAAYYGAHAGIGYIWNMSEASSLDMYTKYLWTRQDSDSVIIEGDSIRFKAMDSHRWRTGAKFSHALATDSGPVFTPYLGAAYEHEFDSKARAASNGEAIDAPDVKGGTGIGELGFSFTPAATSGFSLDLAAQGYTGKREGVGGSFRIKFEF